MKTIEINYRPMPFIPFTRTIKGSLPERWSEINARQLIAIARMFRNNGSETNYLSALLGISKRIVRKMGDFQKYQLHEYFTFLSDFKPHSEFIISELSLSWPVPVNYLAPKPKLKGMSFGQFIYVDSYFNNYRHSKDPADLHKFMASLYLRENDVFSEQLLDCRYPNFKKLKPEITEAAVINWQLIREWLSAAYPLLFQRHSEMVKTESTEQPTYDPNTWIKVFQNFVGDDILHDDLWAAKPIHTIFQYMTRKHKENIRSK